ncbi:hypothetical protein D9M68_869190 [compost metagenome]
MIGRYREGVLKQSDAPADQDQFPDREMTVSGLQVPVPGKSHDDIRNDQQADNDQESHSVAIIKLYYIVFSCIIATTLAGAAEAHTIFSGNTAMSNPE